MIEHGFDCSQAGIACAMVCGDGAIGFGEDCDDGDTDPGDGCSDSCEVESGYKCYGEAS